MGDAAKIEVTWKGVVRFKAPKCPLAVSRWMWGVERCRAYQA